MAVARNKTKAAPARPLESGDRVRICGKHAMAGRVGVIKGRKILCFKPSEERPGFDVELEPVPDDDVPKGHTVFASEAQVKREVNAA